MRLLMLLQGLSAIAYYMTAPFALNVSIILMLVVNTGALCALWWQCASSFDHQIIRFRQARLVFTISLFLLEFLIGLTDSPVSHTAVQGVFNDAEVLLTGLLLGVLWYKELCKV